MIPFFVQLVHRTRVHSECGLVAHVASQMFEYTGSRFENANHPDHFIGISASMKLGHGGFQKRPIVVELAERYVCLFYAQS